jgi:hypothetical protein
MFDRFLVFGHLLQLALDKLSRYLDIEYCVTLLAVMTIAIILMNEIGSCITSRIILNDPAILILLHVYSNQEKSYKSRKCFDESTFKWIVAYYIISVNIIFINYLISIGVKIVNEDP